MSTTTPKTCDVCISNCASCTNKTECTTCKRGFRYNSTDKKCEACTPANCIYCDAAVDTCGTCDAGYSWVAPSCLKCADNCSGCTVAAECNSTSCNSGYAYNPITRTCGKGCSANCTSGCSSAGFGMCDSCDVLYGKKAPSASPPDSSC